MAVVITQFPNLTILGFVLMEIIIIYFIKEMAIITGVHVHADLHCVH